MKLANEPDVTKLGAAKGTYRVKFGLAYFAMYAFCIALCGVGLVMFFGTTGWERIASVILLLFLSTPLAFLLWRTIPTVFDELRLYEQGFVYKSRKGMQTCLWSQIENPDVILDTDNRLKFTSITTKENEVIRFAFKMRGLDVLARAFDAYEYSKIPPNRTENIVAEPTTSAPEAPETAGQIRVYPNPADQYVLLQVPKEVTLPAQAQLLDLTGRVYRRLDIQGYEPVRVDMSTLPGMLLYVRVQDGKRVWRAPVVKM